MITIIAEKPSVAREIAKIVNATKSEDGYMAGNGYHVTWAFGHLIGLAMPNDYGFSSFVKEYLPMMPEKFILKPRQKKEGKEWINDPGVMKQLKIIKGLFNESKSIIVATDAGREGELIFRYIYNYLECKKPFERLWISSLTDKAIKEGLNNLQSGNKFDNLFYSAKCRSEADWLVGINSSQALTISAGNGIFSLGRVQTPTLSMIALRYLDFINFKTQKYYQIKITGQEDDKVFSAISETKFDKIEQSKATIEKINSINKAEVIKYEDKEVNQEPPLLFDLTSLQQEANKKLSLSADQTLTIAQTLYEKKHISYPRTGSRYISDDVFEEITPLILTLKNTKFNTAAEKLLKIGSLNRKCVNAAKVTDHHALIITENTPTSLKGDELNIYEMIAGRMLEAFSPRCKKQTINITLSTCNENFTTSGSRILEPGWREVYNEKEEDENEIELPKLELGETIKIIKSENLEKQTKPKPLHTEASLLLAMETAGKDLEDEEQRQAMKESGIGTPATRASIIETLFQRDYIKREKKNLVPTEKGLGVYHSVSDKKISDVSLTGSWEYALSKIEKGELSASEFDNQIKTFTKEITKEILNTELNIQEAKGKVCPKCSAEAIKPFSKGLKCYNEGCGFIVWDTICEKKLSEKQLTDLITKRKTALIKGFKSKAGKSFDAALKLNNEFKVEFEFEKK
jgi:DNA topoisomerase-3